MQTSSEARKEGRGACICNREKLEIAGQVRWMACEGLGGWEARQVLLVGEERVWRPASVHVPQASLGQHDRHRFPPAA